MMLHPSCLKPGKCVHNAREDRDDGNDDHNSNNNNKECHNVMLPVSPDRQAQLSTSPPIQSEGHHGHQQQSRFMTCVLQMREPDERKKGALMVIYSNLQ